jgi:EmrB/QacA subfamily drug resistance transporter
MTTDPTAASLSARPAPPAGRALLLLFAGLMLSLLLAALNQTVLATALQTMVGELSGTEQLPWVITAYMLASTVSLPVYGKVGDLIGRKSLLLAAICLFVGGSLIGAVAPNMTWLIVARAVQGLGGGGLIVLTQSIIADVVPARERGKYMGAMGGVFAFASVAGPLLGGWFTAGPGWRWAFWINLPLGALALVAVIFLLRLGRPNAARPKIDYLGIALLSAATTFLVLIASWGGAQYAWTSPVVLGLAAGLLVTSVLFVLVEKRAAEPIIPLHLFRNRDFNLTTVAGLFTGVAMFGAIAYLPTYLQMATLTDATMAGLLMIPMMAGILVVSTGTGWYVSRTGQYKWLPMAGSIVVGIALFLMSTPKADTPVWVICAYTTVLGLGLGTSMQLLVLVVQNSFPARQVGTATAANFYFRQVGAALGSAVVGSLFTSRLLDRLHTRLPDPAMLSGGTDSLTPQLLKSLPEPVLQIVVESYNQALMPVFLYMTPLGVLAAVLLCFLTGKPLATRLERDPAPSDSGAEPPSPPAAPTTSPAVRPTTVRKLHPPGRRPAAGGAPAGD